MYYLSNYIWKKGMDREINQDSIAFEQVRFGKDVCIMAVVCDGIGGMPRGQVASGLATEEMIQWFYISVTRLYWHRRNKKYIGRCIHRQMVALHQKFMEEKKKDRTKMGTTFTLCLLMGKYGYYCHLGDSRILLFRKRGETTRLTREHTHKGMLIKALGTFSFQTPDIGSFTMKHKQGVLICSDGFWKQLQEKELEECFQPKEIHNEDIIGRRLETIYELLIKRGTRDDISAIYIQSERKGAIY